MAHSILWRIPTLMIVFSVLSTSVWVSFDHHYLDWYSGHEHLIVVLGHTHDYGGMDFPDTYSHAFPFVSHVLIAKLYIPTQYPN